MISCPMDTTPYGRSDFYLGNDNIRRAGSQPTRFTKALEAEYERCRNDIAYFTRNYVKVLTLDEGLVPMDPYPYQEKMWDTVQNNRFTCILACRQSGKTIGIVAYLLHYAVFNRGKFIAVVAHQGSQAREILDRFTRALENLPFFLQPGCKTLNKGKIVFDTDDTTIQSFSATSGSLRGKSVNLLYLDEFAFVEHDAKFMTATYPIVTAGKTSRVVITSTANGIGNQFHKIYEGAVQKNNSYIPFRVDWWDVTGRDKAWKEQTIANTSLEQFRQEFGNEFIGSSSTLIDPNALLSMVSQKPVWEGDDGVRVYERPKRKDPEDLESKDGTYIMTVDVCKGRGKDYSTFTVFDVGTTPFTQAATFRNCNISPMIFPDVIVKWAKLYNNALTLIESNDEGASVARGCYYDLEYENIFCESLTKASGIGVFVDKMVKRLGCSRLKDMIEGKTLQLCDPDSIYELSAFCRKGQSYEASPGNHDDMVSNLWLFTWFAANDLFSEQLGGFDLKSKLFSAHSDAIESSVPFPGLLARETDPAEYLVAAGYATEDQMENLDEIHSVFADLWR